MLSLTMNLITMTISALLHLAFLIGQLLGQGLVALYRRSRSTAEALSGAAALPVPHEAPLPTDAATAHPSQVPLDIESWHARPTFRSRPEIVTGLARRSA